MEKKNKQKIEREGIKMNKDAKTVDTVRERERESYTLVTESAVLFNSLTHTHTSNFIEKIENKYIRKSSNKSLVK